MTTASERAQQNGLLRQTRRRLKYRIYALRHHYRDRFAFVHINKTGGSSIERALRIPFRHETALEQIERLGPEHWKRRLTFTVVRNPWDKVVSQYHYRSRLNRLSPDEREVSFDKWVHRTFGAQDSKYFNVPRMFMPQTAWITDHDGTILVDRVCRFERLHDDFHAICRELGINAQLPHLKSSRHRPYRDYYSPSLRRIVEEWFRPDLEQFGYEF